MATGTAYAEEQGSRAPFNGMVLQAVTSMPSGGGYSAGREATHLLQDAVSSPGGILQVNSSRAMPSYCSGATYLVFLKVLSRLQADHRLELDPAVINALRPAAQPDGTGLWGRWNANGPGTARLFHELSLGPNFTRIEEAQPGDFLKVFWNDSIGAREHGHSVIYLGRTILGGTPAVTFWSSNIPGGFGTKTVPLARIHRMLFSRLTDPGNLRRIPLLPRSDGYLASLERRGSSQEEMDRQCGLER
jgi:hypothetical protein